MTRIFGLIDYDRIGKLLKKELGETIFRVWTRNEMKAFLSNCVGVGSPFIVHDPDTLQPLMLFTAWSDVAGLARSVWVAEIDEELNVRNPKLIASPDLFNVTGLNTATAFWDDYNEQWVFACTAYGAPKSSYGYFIFFDKNWNVKSTQVMDFTQTVDTSTWAPNLGDAGIGLVPLSDKHLIVTAGMSTGSRYVYEISDFTSRPLGSPKTPLIKLSDTTVVPAMQIPGYMGGSADVHQTFIYNNMLIMLSEIRHNTGNWSLQIYYGPNKDFDYISTNSMIGKYLFVCPTRFSHGIMNYTHVIPNQMRHPHYTSMLGRPLLFFITCPHWNAGGNRRYAHEIWAQTIDPTLAFDPAKNFPLVASGDNLYYFGNIPFATYGVSRAIIWLFGVSAAGTLTLYESSSPYHIWYQTASVVSTNYSISTGSNKIVVENPAPFIGLKTDVTLSEWMVFLS